MAEVSKEAVNDEAIAEETDSATPVSSTKGTIVDATAGDEVNSDGESKTKDEEVTKENGGVSELEEKDSTSAAEPDDGQNTEETDCNGDTPDSVDDSVTIIPGNQEILISVDVDKLMKEGSTCDGEGEVSSSMENGVIEDDDDDDDDDDDIVEVSTPNERNVEECGEWSVKSRLQNFVRWCRSKGFEMSSKVEVTTEGTCHRYGMIATEDIARGEVICSTPRAMVFNPDNSRIVAEIVNYEDWLDTIGQSLDESSGWATLLIALMVEYNDSQSFWAPYLRLVPKPEEYGHPLFWSIEEHKDELRGTTLLYDIQRDIYNIESEYKQFVLPFIYRYKDICGNVERYSLGLYKRLVAFVMAYSFTEDYGCEPNMIPLADILNHHSTKNNAKLIFGDEKVEVIAIKNISKGDEILNTFGKLGNAELLQTYGYADKEPNLYDTLPILVNTFLDVMEKEEKVSDSYFQAKISLLNKTEIAHSDDFFLFDRNGMRRGPDLIQMLKILFMPEEEFDDLLKKRAGNRPDSFYQKLLRKLKLSKRTDTSSGVAVIDIIESDEEAEEEGESAPKRKLDVELHEIEDGEPPAKQSCDSSNQRIPVVQSANTLPADNGDSACNAITIDSDDSDEEDEEETTTTEVEKADGVIDDDAVKENPESVENEKKTESIEENVEDKDKGEKSDEKSDSTNPEKMETDAVATEEEKKDVSSNDTTERDKVETSSESTAVNESPQADDGASNSNETTNTSEKQKDEPDKTKATSEEGKPSEEEGEEDAEEVDDIEIVSEDVRCKVTYESLNKELNKPEWKEFIRRVINFQTNSLKADDLQTADEAREKMTDRQFFSCQIRQGQRHIAKSFLSSLVDDDVNEAEPGK